MLRIAIDKIPEGMSYFAPECDPTDMDLDMEGFYFRDPVKINLEIFRHVTRIFVKFRISTIVQAECVRCLKLVKTKIDIVTEVQYRPMPKLAEDIIDDIGIGYYSDEYLDFTDEVRDSLILELPMRVVCSEDCKGLCPHCGKDLNLGPCDCDREELSLSRFASMIRSLDLKRKLGV